MGNFRKGNDRGGFSRGRSGGDRGGRSGGFSGSRGGGFGGSRGNDRGGFSRGRDSGRRTEMHDAVCSKCGKECQVPFKPTGNKPVLCSDCFRQEGDSGNSFGRSESRTMPGASSEQLKRIEAKLDKILGVLQELEMDVGEEGVDDEGVVEDDFDEDEDFEEDEDGNKGKGDSEDEEDDEDKEEDSGENF